MSSLSRRELLRNSIAAAGSAALVPGAARVTAAEAVGSAEQRDVQAFQTRLQAAQIERQLPLPDHPTNGDEQRYPNRIANYSKGLPHNNLGEVDPNAYNAFLAALATADTEGLENLVMGCPDPA